MWVVCIIIGLILAVVGSHILHPKVGKFSLIVAPLILCFGATICGIWYLYYVFNKPIPQVKPEKKSTPSTPVPSATPVTTAPASKQQTTHSPKRYNFYVPATAAPFDTGIYIARNQTVIITANGQVNTTRDQNEYNRLVSPAGWNDPPGNTKSRIGPLPKNMPFMALACRIGKANLNSEDWMYVGATANFTSDREGKLYLIVNDKADTGNGTYCPTCWNDNVGGFNVAIGLETRIDKENQNSQPIIQEHHEETYQQSYSKPIGKNKWKVFLYNNNWFDTGIFVKSKNTVKVNGDLDTGKCFVSLYAGVPLNKLDFIERANRYYEKTYNDERTNFALTLKLKLINQKNSIVEVEIVD